LYNRNTSGVLKSASSQITAGESADLVVAGEHGVQILWGGEALLADDYALLEQENVPLENLPVNIQLHLHIPVEKISPVLGLIV